jgi:hypothetical protein
LSFRACLNFVFASENWPERVLAKKAGSQVPLGAVCSAKDQFETGSYI